jgi:hypothetical protein
MWDRLPVWGLLFYAASIYGGVWGVALSIRDDIDKREFSRPLVAARLATTSVLALAEFPFRAAWIVALRPAWWVVSRICVFAWAVITSEITIFLCGVYLFVQFVRWAWYH